MGLQRGKGTHVDVFPLHLQVVHLTDLIVQSQAVQGFSPVRDIAFVLILQALLEFAEEVFIL